MIFDGNLFKFLHGRPSFLSLLFIVLFVCPREMFCLMSWWPSSNLYLCVKEIKSQIKNDGLLATYYFHKQQYWLRKPHLLKLRKKKIENSERRNESSVFALSMTMDVGHMLSALNWQLLIKLTRYLRRSLWHVMKNKKLFCI